MAEVKHILVVDDHFEMLEFLRSMLEMSNQDYEVLAVPSAEEGLFELQRAQFDLIITDVRLPGMSGFDLVRRLRKLGRETPVIMITAYSSSQGQKEAEELNVYRYFKKPLDTDNMLTAVHTALHGESITMSPSIELENKDMSKPASSAVQKRLETLRADTGAVLLMLASIQGSIIYADGKLEQVELAGLAEIIARNIKDSFLLADKLNSKEPFSLQYHSGSRIELYCANVGRDHFLTLFFETNLRRGRIGTIWLFTQRAIKDLMQLLNRPDEKQKVVTTTESPDAVDAFLQDTFDSMIGESVEETAVSLTPTQLPPQPDPIPQPPDIPDDPEPEIRLELDPLDVEDEELVALLSGELKKQDTSVDLDSFWDDALSEEDNELSRGMSLDEAMEQGLIPTDMDLEDE